MYSYKLFRLIIIVFMITYFIGCFWWLIVKLINSQEDIEKQNTFITANELDLIFDYSNDTLCDPTHCAEHTLHVGSDEELCKSNEWKKVNCGQDVFTQAIIVCYFALTTLSTIGYGDLYPLSSREMILGIIFMLLGIVFFSQIMGSFIEIIQNYDQRMGGDNDRGSGLNNWMNLLSRFTDKPLPKNLISQIDRHFSFYWANNRLGSITKKDQYLNQCPRALKRHIIQNYLFDDIIYRFRGFFNTQEIKKSNADTEFLYDICFGMHPAKFDSTDDDKLILDEEDEVTDMYFILEGEIKVGFYLLI